MTSLHRSLAAIALPLLLTISNAQGETLKFSSGERQIILIELFTSEGCSSCPPAEAWLARLKDNPRLWHEIIPVAFHVDYWDYLGWKDPFSDPAHGQRQRRYKEEGGIRSVYTPEFVVNGSEWRGWIWRDYPSLTQDSAGPLELTLEGSRVAAHFTIGSGNRSGYTLNLAVLAFDVHSEVSAGENSGRYLKQEFAVAGYKRVSSQNGQWHTELPALINRQATRYGLAAWVNRGANQAPVQATGGWIPASAVGGKKP